MKDDPLDALFVKGDEVNRELLRDILTPYVRLDEKCRIFPMKPFYALTNRSKILVLLLSRKVIALKTGGEEGVSPMELAKLSDMADGSLRPTLSLLVDERLVENENSKYKVFPHALQRCAELLTPRQEPDTSPVTSIRNKATGGARTSMSSIIEDLIRQGGLDEGKSVRQIHELVLQRRPGTIYNALYKVILDLVHAQKLTREIKGDAWVYERPIK